MSKRNKDKPTQERRRLKRALERLYETKKVSVSADSSSVDTQTSS